MPSTSTLVAICNLPLAFLTAWLVWRSREWPLAGDATIFHFIAGQMQMGAVPYRDIVDVNMPLTYAIHAAVVAIGGMSDTAWRAFDVAAAAAVAALILIFVSPAGRAAATLAALVVLLMHLLLGPYSAGQRDFLLCIPALAVALLSARAAEDYDRRLLYLLLSGALGMAAAFIKPSGALLLLLPAAALRLRARELVSLMAGAAAVALAVLGTLAARGGLGAFVKMSYELWPGYSSMGAVSLAETLEALRWIGPVAGLALAATLSIPQLNLTARSRAVDAPTHRRLDRNPSPRSSRGEGWGEGPINAEASIGSAPHPTLSPYGHPATQALRGPRPTGRGSRPSMSQSRSDLTATRDVSTRPIRLRLIIALTVLGLIHLLAQRKGWSYHVYPLAIGLACWGAWVLPGLSRWHALACLAVIAASLIWLVPNSWYQVEHDPSLQASAAMQSALQSHLPRGARVQVLDADNGAFLAMARAGMRQATPHIQWFSLLIGRHPRRQEFLHALAADPPAAVLLTNAEWPMASGFEAADNWPALRAFLRSRYELIATGHHDYIDWRLYLRQGSSISGPPTPDVSRAAASH